MTKVEISVAGKGLNFRKQILKILVYSIHPVRGEAREPTKI
jgi:hypothetical protein